MNAEHPVRHIRTGQDVSDHSLKKVVPVHTIKSSLGTDSTS